MIDPKTSMPAKSTVLPSHIAETVDAVAQIHADHHLKRSAIERFMDNWTARLARPAVLAGVVCGVAFWMAINLLAPLGGYTNIDAPRVKNATTPLLHCQAPMLGDLDPIPEGVLTASMRAAESTFCLQCYRSKERAISAGVLRRLNQI